MTLNEFILHQKHNSVNIRIEVGDDTKFIGDIGCYKHWIGKSTYGDDEIEMIYFIRKFWNIFLF